MQSDWYTTFRGRVTAIFGTPQGVWALKHIVNPLDYLFYRLSGGRLVFVNGLMPTLMLTTTGAKSGQPRTVPLIYTRDGQRFVVLASNYGGATHPAWYHNLRTNPACMVTVNGREQLCVAHEADGAEREELWRRAVIFYGGYRTYQARAEGRRIPVMVLEPVLA